MPTLLQLSTHQAQPAVIVPLDYIEAVARAAGWPRAAAARFLFGAGAPAEGLESTSMQTRQLVDLAAELAAAAFGVARLLPQEVLGRKSPRALAADRHRR